MCPSYNRKTKGGDFFKSMEPNPGIVSVKKTLLALNPFTPNENDQLELMYCSVFM